MILVFLYSTILAYLGYFRWEFDFILIRLALGFQLLSHFVANYARLLLPFMIYFPFSILIIVFLRFSWVLRFCLLCPLVHHIFLVKKF